MRSSLSRDRHPAPLWFVLVCMAAFVVVARLTTPATSDPLAVQQGFWIFVALLAGWIWKGLEVVGRVSLHVLHASVIALWGFARSVFNGLLDLGKLAAHGFKAAWGLLRQLYTDILRPVWIKFWKLIDRLRGTLERIFRPVLDFLNTIREELLGFYDDWIRPILDTIGIARKWLNILSLLHIDFAKKLDAKLASIEDAIDAPFRFVLGQLNALINLVNRIVTADGLFQRLALVRSLERDMLYVDRLWRNMRSHPLTNSDRNDLAEVNRPPTIEQMGRDFDRYLQTRDGPVAELLESVDFTGTIYDESHVLPA